MSFLRDLYGTFIRISIAIEIQYRASSAIWLMGMVIEPLIYLVVWSAAAEAQGGTVGGYGPHEFAAYYLVLAAVNQITSGWHMWEFQYRVQQGQFAFLLLRPVHPIHGDLAENLAHKLAMQVALLPALRPAGARLPAARRAARLVTRAVRARARARPSRCASCSSGRSRSPASGPRASWP